MPKVDVFISHYTVFCVRPIMAKYLCCKFYVSFHFIACGQLHCRLNPSSNFFKLNLLSGVSRGCCWLQRTKIVSENCRMWLLIATAVAHIHKFNLFTKLLGYLAIYNNISDHQKHCLRTVSLFHSQTEFTSDPCLESVTCYFLFNRVSLCSPRSLCAPFCTICASDPVLRT